MAQKIALILTSLCVVFYVSQVSAAPRQTCTKVVDIAMVVDESGSIGQKNFERVKTFLQDMISRFSVAPFGAHFGVVKYSSSPRLVFSLSKYTDAAQLQNAIRKMKYRGGSTYTGKALLFTKENIFGQTEDREDVPNILVLFSDGMSHDHSTAMKEARKMKEKGVAILCVGIGRGKEVERLINQLKKLATKPEYVFKSPIDALQTIEDSLVKDVCESADPCLSFPCKNGGECVRSGESYICKCTPNWEGKQCEFEKWCPTSFSKRGCYKTELDKPGATLLFNRRHSIDWFDGWDKFLETIVCDCGKAAKDNGFRYFCIEFYGECWGYHQFDVSRPHAGATQCWGKRPNYDTCIHDQKNPVCVGTANHGYVYELNNKYANAV